MKHRNVYALEVLRAFYCFSDWLPNQNCTTYFRVKRTRMDHLFSINSRGNLSIYKIQQFIAFFLP